MTFVMIVFLAMVAVFDIIIAAIVTYLWMSETGRERAYGILLAAFMIFTIGNIFCVYQTFCGFLR